MLPGRKNNQSFFGGAVACHWDNGRINSILVVRELNNIIAGRAMFQSRKFNTRLENAFEILLLRQIVSVGKIISSMVEVFSLPLVVSLFFNLFFGFCFCDKLCR